MTLEQFLHDEKYGNKKLVGKLVTFKDGSQLLIGDINFLGGECDDCRTHYLNKEIECVEEVWRHK